MEQQSNRRRPYVYPKESGFWTDERVAKLKKLWAEGLSASFIAKELGARSRSAVIGKVHRLGLSGRKRMGGTARPAVQKRRKIKQRVSVAVVRNYGSGMGQVQHIEREVADNVIFTDLEIADDQRRTLTELKDHHCRWPIGNPGEPDFFYCGAASIEGASYCARHFRVAHRVTVDMRPGFRASCVVALEEEAA